MKKLMMAIVGAVIVCAAMTAGAEDVRDKWTNAEALGEYGYVKCGERFYPLDNSGDFDYCFRKDCNKNNGLERKNYDIYLTADYEADNLVVDANILRIDLNGHNLKIRGDVTATTTTTEGASYIYVLQLRGGGGTISFPYNSGYAFGIRFDNGDAESYFHWPELKNEYLIQDVTFANCLGTVFDIYTRNNVSVTFSNVTFDHCSAERGSCIYVNSVLVDMMVEGCSFVNCSASGDGGAVYVNNVYNGGYIDFLNTSAVNCSAADCGGFMYINDSDAAIYGRNSTFVSGCSAVNGGGVYADKVNKLEGFIFSDNLATERGGGVYNNSGSESASAVLSCRFYRNATSEGYGGGMYVDDANGRIEGCKFFHNEGHERGYELYVDDGGTLIKNCTFTSGYVDSAAVYGGTQSGTAFKDSGAYALSCGSGAADDPYVISSIDDWDAFYCLMRDYYELDGRQAGNDFAGQYVRLDVDIAVCSAIGAYSGDASHKKPFRGTFDGNGHAITLALGGNGSDKGLFSCAEGATVRNLTVNGTIIGDYSLGGIIGNASGCTVEDCVNNATIIGENDFIGGIAGWTGYGSKFRGCTNNGRIIGYQSSGGIAGLSGGNARFLNCLNYGDVTAYRFAGGIVGFEESAVSAENCHSAGAVTVTDPGVYPEEGDYVIYTAMDATKCLEIQGGPTAVESGRLLQLWTATGTGSKVFTLTYDTQSKSYVITAKHSGLALTTEKDMMSVAFSGGEWSDVYQYQAQDDLLTRQRWTFAKSSDGYFYIQSLAFSSPLWYLNVALGNTDDGTGVGAYRYQSGGLNDRFRLVAEPNQVAQSPISGGITGHHYAGSSYECCYYNRDGYPADGYGTGVSREAFLGHATESIAGGRESAMPYLANDYIKGNDKAEDGWRRLAFADNGKLVFIRDDAAVYVNPRGLTTFRDGSKTVGPDDVVLGEEGKKTVYVVAESISRTGRIRILGDVMLVVNDGCTYDIRGGINLERDNTLTLAAESLGGRMGRIVATATTAGDAAIGGNAGTAGVDGGTLVSTEIHHGGTLNVYGGDVSVSGCSDDRAFGVGIGGGSGVVYSFVAGGKTDSFETGGGNGCAVSMYNGTLDVKAGKNAVGVGGGAGHCIVRYENGVCAQEWIGNGGSGGSFDFHGGAVTVKSDLAAFGYGFRGDGMISQGVGQTKIRCLSEDPMFLHFGTSSSDAAAIWYRAEADAENLLGCKFGRIVSGHPGQHQYTKAEYVWSDDHRSCSARLVCLACADGFPGHVYDTEEGTVVLSGHGANHNTYKATFSNFMWFSTQYVRVYGEPIDHRDEDGDGRCDVCGVLRSVDCVGKTVNADGTVSTTAETASGFPTPVAADDEVWSGGWYVLDEDITLKGRPTVDGEVHLVLMDGKTLTAAHGITVGTGNALTIHAQSEGGIMGRLVATGDDRCAGIGGIAGGACGTVTINGGEVTAQGGKWGAGIGGGYEGVGGVFAVRGGAVKSVAGLDAATVGRGWRGDADGTVVLAGGIFGMTVEDGWYDKDRYLLVGNADDETRDAFPWSVVRAAKVTLGEFPHFAAVWTSGEGAVSNVIEGTSFMVLRGTTNVKIVFTMDPAYELVSGRLVLELGTVNTDMTLEELPTAVHRKVEYVDADGCVKENDVFAVVTAATDKLNSGWYLVEGIVSRNGIDIPEDGKVNLILADGASLTVQGADGGAGIDVRSGETLNIYGQRNGTGKLVARGGSNGAGIGGGNWGDGGTVTIYGGNVTAQGGKHGAGIGGGYQGDGCTVTNNGGSVTATGGLYGAGIGGGYKGDGCTVTVKGGTVTATGGQYGAGIGGGASADGGTVGISGGAIKVLAGGNAPTAIGGGYNRSDDGRISIIGGVFGMTVADEWYDTSRYTVIDNQDAETKTAYPYAVVPYALKCTGGTIFWSVMANAWAVTPNAGVTAVTISGLPEGAKLAVKVGDYAVPSSAFVGFGGGGKTFSLALDEDGVVNGVPVKPIIGDLDAGEPFAVGEGAVAVTVKAIPGLRYALVRGESVEAVCGGETPPPQKVVVESKVAEDTTVTVTDDEPPPDKAFYTIGVSVP